MPSNSPIDVYIVPTTSYNLLSKGTSLFKLCDILNKQQKKYQQSFRFYVLLAHFMLEKDVSTKAYDNMGLVLEQKQPFENFRFNEMCHTPIGIREEARRNYIADKDAFQQITSFAASTVGRVAVQNSMIVGIGSEVISEDDRYAEVTGIAEDDAYSCLGNVMSTKDDNNNNEYKYQNVCYISLARATADAVFPELKAMPDGALTSRAIVARYITANLCHFISGRIFVKNLNRDHGALCVAESNWTSGGGERAAYAAEGLCRKCMLEIQKTGVANKYRENIDWLSGAIAIAALSSIPNKIDNAAAANV